MLGPCETCLYFDAPRSSWGNCKRRSPTADAKANGNPVWPRIHSTDGCGDHEARPIKENPDQATFALLGVL